MCFPKSDAGGRAQELQMQQEQQVRQADKQIDSAFAGFTPQFFNQRAQAYQQAALPQLQRQYGQVLDQTGFKLANQGLAKSSQATHLGQELGTDYNLAAQGIAGEGIRQAQSLQQQVANQKSGLMAQANAASNPLSVASGALNTAASYAAPSAIAPLGPMFQGFANTFLANQLNNAYGNPYGQQGQRLSYGGTALPSAQRIG